LLLDVGRHFFGVAHIKSLLDQLALHKMNVLQLHLTDDQGWRVEIRKHPRLAEISAWRKETVIGKNTGRYDGARHGGFYTHADLREIIACARQRHITVVPEIEMPGHAQAALAAYPELSCTGGPFEVATSWGIMKDVFCAGNDKVFKFLEDVLTEVLALFPSEFIHIGGDECLKDRWKKCPKCQARIKAGGLKDEHELQSWFVRRIERFLSGRRRRLIGWDEILEGGLAPGATVMSWRGTAGGIAAANANHDVVMTPRNPCYLDYYQSRDTAAEPFAIGGFNSLEMACEWEPIPAEVSTDKRHHILGGQANVWTEYMADWRHVEYMTHPRLAGLAEALWSPKERRGWPDFRRRLDAHLRRLDAMGVNYRRQQDQS
jgi:hexosaminidase